jgi:hypothetical protein
MGLATCQTAHFEAYGYLFSPQLVDLVNAKVSPVYVLKVNTDRRVVEITYNPPNPGC